MTYPIWDLGDLGGGTLIAIIAIIHTYVAQFAVGGGIFIAWADGYAQKKNDAVLTDWIRRHTGFFVLLTMVFGGVTGVGIWFVIGLVHPAATSSLIHTFVFAWAIEWVFFVIEIVSLLVYHYRFESLDGPTRKRLAWVYAGAAWASLFVINGILSFMLTPGGWLESGDFWQGFFNPTFVASTVFRTGNSLIFAGLFGFATAVMLKDPEHRARMLRICSVWVIGPAVLVALSGYWYMSALPDDVAARLFARNPEAAPFITVAWFGAAAALVAAAVLVIRLPRRLQQGVVALALVVGLGWHGGFEYLREIARKPWVISGHMYSNGVKPAEIAALNEGGVLAHTGWVTTREITPQNRAEVGRELFVLQCQACHTISGYNAIDNKLGALTHAGIEARLSGIGTLKDYMPPIVGTPAERHALATYLATVVGRPVDAGLDPKKAAPRAAEVPKPERGSHVLLAWNDRGMHAISDSAPWFSIAPPSNTIEAQLFERGDGPERVTEEVELRYHTDPQHAHPERHVRFWKHARALLGRDLKAGVGPTGNGTSGKLHLDPKSGTFAAHGIPVVPYREDGGFDPYPLVTIEARTKDGAVLARTQVTAPTSTELRCATCHGGKWSNEVAGLSDDTAVAILQLHDRNHGTTLHADAVGGRPALCQSCHADPVVGAEGRSGVLGLSAAVHGFHARVMHLEGARACQSCHPANPKGVTAGFRGVHQRHGLDCTSCHGQLPDHAASLLLAEGDSAVAKERLEQLGVSKEIAPRTAWEQQPDCATCHIDFAKPTRGPDGAAPSAFGRWTRDASQSYRNRADENGVRCAACHGSVHALYPATNPVEQHRDNLQPLRLQGSPYAISTDGRCDVCHTSDPGDEPHHPNMGQPFRHPGLFPNPAPGSKATYDE